MFFYIIFFPNQDSTFRTVPFTAESDMFEDGTPVPFTGCYAPGIPGMVDPRIFGTDASGPAIAKFNDDPSRENFDIEDNVPFQANVSGSAYTVVRSSGSIYSSCYP